MIVKSDKYRQWGKHFYAIPDAAFNPTIEVTYDVELEDQNGKNVTTRQDVTNSIVLSKTNFSAIQQGTPGHINAIRILIKPRYLYVLADEDKIFKSMAVNYSPDNNIDMILERIYLKLLKFFNLFI